MSYQEAVEDRIPMAKTQSGQNVYHPRCHVCGGSAYSWSYNRKTKYRCRECRNKKAKPGFMRKVCT